MRGSAPCPAYGDSTGGKLSRSDGGADQQTKALKNLNKNFFTDCAFIIAYQSGFVKFLLLIGLDLRH